MVEYLKLKPDLFSTANIGILLSVHHFPRTSTHCFNQIDELLVDFVGWKNMGAGSYERLEPEKSPSKWQRHSSSIYLHDFGFKMLVCWRCVCQIGINLIIIQQAKLSAMWFVLIWKYFLGIQGHLLRFGIWTPQNIPIYWIYPPPSSSGIFPLFGRMHEVCAVTLLSRFGVVTWRGCKCSKIRTSKLPIRN